MKVSRRPLRIRFEANEEPLLLSLLAGLREILRATDGADDPVVRRLFPDAYPDDHVAESDYRSITESDLRTDRVERLSACITEIETDRTVTIADPDVATRWIQVLNDLRLALGTRIGVSDDNSDTDPGLPGNETWYLYHWLTAVQDEVVTALMR